MGGGAADGDGDGVEGVDDFGLGVEMDFAKADHFDEAREAGDAVGVNAVGCSVGEEEGAVGGALGR